MHLVIFSFCLYFSISTFAEYRVFTLKITNTKINVTRTIKSTLDPEQYQSFYPLNPNESISYIKTWRCLGSTRDFAALCEPPLNIEQPQQNSSENTPQ